jgi:Gpi18-like mannosyltransferase
MARKSSLFWQIITGVAVWRLLLFVLAVLADRWLVYDPSFPYAPEILAQLNLPRWLYSWGGFDGVHYLSITAKGYADTAFVQAFFPVFPLLLRFFANPLLAGLILNFMLTAAVALVLYQLVLLDYSAKVAKWSFLAFLLFPTSLFLGSLYTEPLFLLLVLGSFLMARKGQWAWAGILAGLASGTRIIGVLLLPALLVELWLQAKPKSIKQFIRERWRQLAWLALGLTGLLGYMYYLWLTFGDPLYFLHVQAEFGSGRQESLVLLPQVIWRYVKILWTARPFDWKYFVYAQEFFLSLGVLSALIVWYKRIRPSYLVFSLLSFILPTLTGTLTSMPRYVLACFPLFLLLGQYYSVKSLSRTLLLTASVILLIINSVLFIQGYWVA